MDTHELNFEFSTPGLSAVLPSLAVQPQLQDLPAPPPRGRVLILEDDPLQLQLLTRRNDPAPDQTWGADAAQVLASASDAAGARRLQNVLKALLRK